MIDYAKNTFYGRTFDEWRAISDLMGSRGLNTPAELARALSPMRAEDMVDVVDSKNHDRILGRVPRRLLGCLDGPNVLMAVMPSPRLIAMMHPGEPVAPAEVRFMIEWRTAPDGWTRTAVLATSAPLGVLMMIDGFHLPGETGTSAYDRRRRA